MSDPRTPARDATGDGPARGPGRQARIRRALHHPGQLSFGCAVVALAAVLPGVAVLASGVDAPGWIAADLARRQMDMQGVISPVYVLNAIGQLFTRRGEGLIGFNYTLKGPAMRPQVAVNPFSALTPGFLREMFRKPAPQVEGRRPARRAKAPRDTR